MKVRKVALKGLLVFIFLLSLTVSTANAQDNTVN